MNRFQPWGRGVAAVAALVGASFCLAVAGAARADAPGEQTFGGRECAVPARIAAIKGSLPRTALSLRNEEPVKIIAIGSSSTQGVGATTPEHTYPAQLERELALRFPASVIHVVNKGVGGQLARDMVARIESDAIERRPSLVIWQTGTNDAERHVPGEDFAAEMIDGVGRLRAAQIDVLLVGPQYTPRVQAGRNKDYPLYARLFEMLHRDTAAARFHRFDIMRYWIESGRFSFASMLASDRFHMNDRSYSCLALVLADAIEQAVRK